ncbi:hypothetical protein BH23ACT7_BH23ACT7_04350 [soil metagenome]
MRIALLVSGDLPWALRLARRWVAGGDAVTVVLLDGAASSARRGHAHAEAVKDGAAAGVVVLAHDDALRRRAIRGDGMLDGVKTVDLDEVADLVLDGADKVMWL